VLSTLALVSMVVVVPVVLATVGGSPVPHGGLAGLDHLFHRRQGFDLRLATAWVLHGALALAWVTWAWMAVCVGIELVARSRGRAPTRLPGSRTMQAMVACLVGTSLALVTVGRTLPAPTVRAAPTAGAPAPEAFASLRVLTEYPLDDLGGDRSVHGRSSEGVDGATFPGLVAAADPHVNLASAPEVGFAPEPSSSPNSPNGRVIAPVHTVSGRQTLWSIAEERLGSARRWREIADLNYSVRQPDGGALGDDHWVASGWRLLLPPDASHVVTSSPASPEHRSVPVVTSAHVELAVDILPGPAAVAPGSGGVTPTPAPTAASDGYPGHRGSGPRIPLVPIGSGLAGAGVVGGGGGGAPPAPPAPGTACTWQHSPAKEIFTLSDVINGSITAPTPLFQYTTSLSGGTPVPYSTAAGSQWVDAFGPNTCIEQGDCPADQITSINITFQVQPRGATSSVYQTTVTPVSIPYAQNVG
jgi:hypothetical protein